MNRRFIFTLSMLPIYLLLANIPVLSVELVLPLLVVVYLVSGVKYALSMVALLPLVNGPDFLITVYGGLTALFPSSFLYVVLLTAFGVAVGLGMVSSQVVLLAKCKKLWGRRIRAAMETIEIVEHRWR